MAQIPIFQEGEAQGQTPDTSVRPTRIFLKEPTDRVPGALDRLGSSMEDVGKRMTAQIRMNQFNQGQAAYEKQLTAAKMQLANTPFTSYDDHIALATKLSDPTVLQKAVKGQGDLLVANHLQGNLAVRQAEFLAEASGQGLVKQHQKLQGDLDGFLNDRAQAVAASNPRDYPLLKQQGIDAIDGAIRTGTYTAKEGESRKQLFLNHIDFAGASGYAQQDPGHAGLMFTDPQATAKQYPTLTPEQRMHALGIAHETMTWADNESERRMKALQKPTEDEFWQRYNNGTATSEWVNDKFDHSLIPRALVMLATGKPPTTEGNYWAYSAYMEQMNDPLNQNYAALNQIRQTMDGDDSLGKYQRKPLMDMYGTKIAGVETPIAAARREATTQFQDGINAWAQEGFSQEAQIISGQRALYPNGGPIKTAIAKAEREFKNGIMVASSPEDVQAYAEKFNFEKYRPQIAGQGFERPANYTPPDIEFEPAPLPPPGLVPVLKTMKIIPPLPATSVVPGEGAAAPAGAEPTHYTPEPTP